MDTVAICNSRNSDLLFKIQVLTFEKLGVALVSGGRAVIMNHRHIYSLCWRMPMTNPQVYQKRQDQTSKTSAANVRPLYDVPSKPLTLDLMETLDLIFRRAFYHWSTSYRKMKRIKVVEKRPIYKFVSVHFLYMIHPQMLQSLQEKVQSLHEVQS